MRRFAFQLARDFGYLDVEAMLQSMSSRRFREWLAFYELQPPLDESLPVYLASVVKAIFNTTSKEGARLTMDDCRVWLGDARPPAKKRRQTGKEFSDIMRGVAMAYAPGVKAKDM